VIDGIERICVVTSTTALADVVTAVRIMRIVVLRIRTHRMVTERRTYTRWLLLLLVLLWLWLLQGGRKRRRRMVFWVLPMKRFRLRQTHSGPGVLHLVIHEIIYSFHCLETLNPTNKTPLWVVSKRCTP
jgi:hypothetical protein